MPDPTHVPRPRTQAVLGWLFVVVCGLYLLIVALNIPYFPVLELDEFHMRCLWIGMSDHAADCRISRTGIGMALLAPLPLLLAYGGPPAVALTLLRQNRPLCWTMSLSYIAGLLISVFAVSAAVIVSGAGSFAAFAGAGLWLWRRVRA